MKGISLGTGIMAPSACILRRAYRSGENSSIKDAKRLFESKLNFMSASNNMQSFRDTYLGPYELDLRLELKQT